MNFLDKLKKNLVVDIFENKTEIIESNSKKIEKETKKAIVDILKDSIRALRIDEQKDISRVDRIKLSAQIDEIKEHFQNVKKYFIEQDKILSSIEEEFPDFSLGSIYHIINSDGFEQSIKYMLSIEFTANLPKDKKLMSLIELLKAYHYLILGDMNNCKLSFINSVNRNSFFDNLLYFINFLISREDYQRALGYLEYIDTKLETTDIQKAIYHKLDGDVKFQTNELESAIDNYKESLNYYKNLNSENKYIVDISYIKRKIALAHIKNKNFDLAYEYINKAYESINQIKKYLTKDTLLKIDILEDISLIETHNDNVEKSMKLLNEILDICKNVPSKLNNEQIIFKNSMANFKLATLYEKNKDYKTSISHYSTAINIITPIIDDNLSKYLLYFCKIKFALAQVYAHTNEFNKVVVILQNILEDSEILNSRTILQELNLVKIFTLLSQSYVKFNKINQAIKCTNENIKYCKRLYSSKPKTFIWPMIDAKTFLVSLYLRKQDYDKVESGMIEVISLRTKLSKQKLEHNTFGISKLYEQIGYIYFKNKEDVKAIGSFRNALKYKKEILSSNPKEYLKSYLSIAHNLFYLLSKNDRIKEADTTLEENIPICQYVIQKKITSSYENSLKILNSYYKLKNNSKILDLIKNLEQKIDDL
jgi:tetratricopeptide (TPR) repeat protein